MLAKSLISKVKYSFSQLIRKNFKKLQQSDISYFTSILGINKILKDAYQIQPYNKCFRGIDIGHSSLVLLPSTTEQVSQILKYCNEHKLGVVPQGGNTGLVGGSVPVFDQIIINFSKMNKILNFDQISGVISCQTGCVLEKLNQYLEQYGSQIPLDLGAKGSCHIGGNAATNAGGKYVVKYGSLRSHILGVEVVLPNGQILNLRSQIHKDNTGYDLKQLFIGSQGTIGAITKLDIHCQKLDQNRRIMSLKVNSFQSILKMIPIIKKKLGKQLNALQYMQGYTYLMVDKYLKSNILSNVSPDDHIIFIQSPCQKFQDLFVQLQQQGIPIDDAILSTNDVQFKKIWKVRQDVAVLAKNQGKVLAYDISFDVKEWANMTCGLRKTSGKPVFGYGHIGDGNIHINIVCNQESQMQWHDQSIFKEVTQRKGSISAEHGVGLHKPQYLHLQKSNQVLNVMRSVKNLFDPNGIMNPYKVIPQ